MIRLGIIGAENSHSYSIASICNIDKSVPMRATHLWGETAALAAASAKKGSIPRIVGDWREMLGDVDGVMIGHRDGALHYQVAKFFIERKVPTYVDKPLTTKLAEARKLLALADRTKTPVCSFSVIPLQAQFKKFASSLAGAGPVKALNSSGPMDIGGPYGVFFYGIHQIEAIVEIMGAAAKSVQLYKNGKDCVATIFFSGQRIVTLNGLAEGGLFHWRACLHEKIRTFSHSADSNLYLEGAKIIYRLIRFGDVPWSRSRLLAPVAILEALQKSLQTGRLEAVSRA